MEFYCLFEGKASFFDTRIRYLTLKHVPRYLEKFEYRFNRRYRLDDMIERLAYVGLRTPPMPYRFLRMAEIGG